MVDPAAERGSKAVNALTAINVAAAADAASADVSSPAICR
jgi:hypothetical protein